MAHSNEAAQPRRQQCAAAIVTQRDRRSMGLANDMQCILDQPASPRTPLRHRPFAGTDGHHRCTKLGYIAHPDADRKPTPPPPSPTPRAPLRTLDGLRAADPVLGLALLMLVALLLAELPSTAPWRILRICGLMLTGDATPVMMLRLFDGLELDPGSR
ncbi:MAG: hypothetical protein IPP50_04435 [Piscinibacter sp.]|nr:hypothetical protein [Piscinibacter sp.]